MTEVLELAQESEISTFVEKQQQKGLLRFLTCGSVDDGKSTLIGRLLYDCSQVYEDQLAAIDGISKQNLAGEIDFSLLVDGLAAEREQGITIDVAYRYFSTEKRKFIIADTPGHEQYTRNMVTGASNCDLAILLVDARLGVLDQTKRHATIAKLLGLRSIVVAVNKMDLVDYSEQVFEGIKSDLTPLINTLGDISITYVPICAVSGENIVNGSDNMSWYQGKKLLTVLEEADNVTHAQDEWVLPVQYVTRPDLHYRGFAGTLQNGDLAVGDEVTVLPSNKQSKVKSIDIFEGSVGTAVAEQAITISLEDNIDVSRGDVLAKSGQGLVHTNRFDANIVVMSEQGIQLNHPYYFKVGHKTVTGSIVAIEYELDLHDLSHKNVDQLKLNSVAKVSVVLDESVVMSRYQQLAKLGAFIMVDKISHETAGALMVEQVQTEQKRQYDQFELELNALICKRYPHWGAIDLSKG